MRADKLNLPIYESIKKYIDSNPIPFHMPGHKLGRGLPPELSGDLTCLDITELPGTDNLHQPEGPIKAAQELAARAFKADRTFFLVNGSTCGIHAMISAICRPGDCLIVSRDCHISVINGLYLAGARPVYIIPSYSSKYGISTTVTPEAVSAALESNPGAAGVLLTRPTYYGVCSDIKAIAREVHRQGKLLAVDEAHGAHLAFHRDLPVSSMEAGADICVQSAHKTLPALTQTAYLHVRGESVDLERLTYILSAIQTSSPSYLLMASLDAARAVMEREGEKRLESLMYNCRSIRRSIAEKGCLYSPGPDDIIYAETDETRLVVNVSGTGLSGYEAEAVLRRDYSIQAEMSDLYNILFIATIADTGREFGLLEKALTGLSGYNGSLGSERPGNSPGLPETGLSLREALERRGSLVELDRAGGRVSRGMITPYPPGIPVVNPGEIIDEGIIEYIQGIIKAGGKVSGLTGDELVSVVD